MDTAQVQCACHREIRPTFRNDAFIAPSRVSALLERQMVLFFARGVVFCKAEVPWHSNDIELCVFVHESAFVENPETYKSGKTARNGLSFCLKTYSMNKISKAGHSLYKSPHEQTLSDSNKGQAVGRPCLDWT